MRRSRPRGGMRRTGRTRPAEKAREKGTEERGKHGGKGRRWRQRSSAKREDDKV